MRVYRYICVYISYIHTHTGFLYSYEIRSYYMCIYIYNIYIIYTYSISV